MKKIVLHTLKRWFLRECDRLGVDPQEFDFESIVDPALTYYENKQLLKDEIRMVSPGAFQQEEWAPILEDEYREARAAMQQFMKEHALSHYILCSMNGETVSSETGPPIQRRRFSLADYIRATA